MVDKIEINKLYIQSDSQKDSDLELSNTPSYIFHNKETKIINNFRFSFWDFEEFYSVPGILSKPEEYKVNHRENYKNGIVY